MARACLSLAAVVALAGPPAAPVRAQDGLTLSEQDLVQGRTHYIASCARCHGVNGGGGEGPPLARARLPRAPDTAALMRIMSEGIPGTAMSGSWWLSQVELRQVAGFVRSLAPADSEPGGSPAGDPEHGRELYERERCATCHTVNGFGTARGPDLTAVGRRRGATYLREAILDPAAALPRGLTAMPSDFVDYLTVRIVDADGRELRGMRMNEDTYSIQIKDARGVIHSFYKPELRALDKEFDTSLMRSYRDALSEEEVDDLVTYLMSLTDTESRLIS